MREPKFTPEVWGTEGGVLTIVYIVKDFNILSDQLTPFMNIHLYGEYKSLSAFQWNEIPKLAIITGPNGSGKSQLLELINGTILQNAYPPAIIENIELKREEIIYLKGEWDLNSITSINLANLQSKTSGLYQHFINRDTYTLSPRFQAALQEIYNLPNRNFNEITESEFNSLLPKVLYNTENEIGQQLGEVFYKYRLSEIDMIVSGMTPEQVITKIGNKPWEVLRAVFNEAKLPFDVNDPSSISIMDSFQLSLTHTILQKQIDLKDLSSGEKVLISLVIYLYNSQENLLLPRLMLLDEPDAHLHPSMAQQFLNVIKNVFVEKLGIRVILTTHSPSTVILAPETSIFEMSINEPRISKAASKNHAVSLLTAGLVYVGEGTKYFLVEDKDDVDFYSYIYKQIALEGFIDTNIPLVFIKVSISDRNHNKDNDKSGGKDLVKNWVSKLQESGLNNVLRGLIDEDNGNEIFEGVYKIQRYSIENYLIDPILTYAALMDKELQPSLEGIGLAVGEEYKLKLLDNQLLQRVADSIIYQIEPELAAYIEGYDASENERVSIKFTNGSELQYPKWLFTRRGKTLLQVVYNKVFNSSIVNATTLSKAMRKLNMFPQDIVETLNTLRNN